MPRHHNNQPLAGAITQPGRFPRQLTGATHAPRLALIDRAVETHVANEHRILAALKAADLAALDHRLALLLAALESPRGAVILRPAQ